MANKRKTAMKAYFLFMGSGPLVILTSYDSIENPTLVGRLAAKGITKFISCEVSADLARERYGKHFDIVLQDLHETDDLRVLDYSGDRAFRSFNFKELGVPVFHQPEE